MSRRLRYPLSAQSLKLYRQCPLRFKYRYLDRLLLTHPWGQSEADRRAMAQGEAFHLMASRYYAGLGPGRGGGPEEQRELADWFGRLQTFLPRTFDQVFYPELELRLQTPDLWLTATFDLLVVEPDGRAVIYDWKTHRRIHRRSELLASPQTLVYRYMLCAAGGAYSPQGRFEPEAVSMIYWNPHHPARAERLEYSTEQFAADEAYLKQQFAAVEAAEAFPPTADPGDCQRCEFRAFCHGRPPELLELEEEVDAADWSPEVWPE